MFNTKQRWNPSYLDAGARASSAAVWMRGVAAQGCRCAYDSLWSGAEFGISLDDLVHSFQEILLCDLGKQAARFAPRMSTAQSWPDHSSDHSCQIAIKRP